MEVKGETQQNTIRIKFETILGLLRRVSLVLLPMHSLFCFAAAAFEPWI